MKKENSESTTIFDPEKVSEALGKMVKLIFIIGLIGLGVFLLLIASAHHLYKSFPSNNVSFGAAIPNVNTIFGSLC